MNFYSMSKLWSKEGKDVKRAFVHGPANPKFANVTG